MGAIVECAKDALNFAILRRCIRACEPESDAIGGVERTKRGIVKFAAVVRLEGKDRACKLSVNISMEVLNGAGNVGFLA